MVPWKGGKVLIWDATCPDTLAPSHLLMTVREAGAVANDTEYRNKPKYSSVRVVIETLSALGDGARAFLREVG